ncbi:phosphatase PAP2 family protein [Streptomyces globosus]|uniref:phosphatase PAP2 family protein n=1 Tax=Streptomyces globosus TaxID=68209 RepID=UPI0038015D41
MRCGWVRWTGIGCAVLWMVLTVLVAAGWRPLLSGDGAVAVRLHAYAVRNPEATAVVRVLSDVVWDPWMMRALAVAACVWLWRRGRGELALRVAAATVAAALVNQGMKSLVGRERPQWADPVDSASYAAYPSGHAATAAAVCLVLLWLLLRRVPRAPAWSVAAAAVLAAVSVLGVGFTRVFLGVHWASDVLAGWVLGAGLAALAITVPLGVRRTGPAEAGRREPSGRA